MDAVGATVSQTHNEEMARSAIIIQQVANLPRVYWPSKPSTPGAFSGQRQGWKPQEDPLAVTPNGELKKIMT